MSRYSHLVSALLWFAAFLTVVPNVIASSTSTRRKSKTKPRTAICYDEWGHRILCPIWAPRTGVACYNTTQQVWDRIPCPCRNAHGDIVPCSRKRTKLILIIVFSIVGGIVLILLLWVFGAFRWMKRCCSRRTKADKYQKVEDAEHDAVKSEQPAQTSYNAEYTTPYDPPTSQPPPHLGEAASYYQAPVLEYQKNSTTDTPGYGFQPPSGPPPATGPPTYQPSYPPPTH